MGGILFHGSGMRFFCVSISRASIYVNATHNIFKYLRYENIKKNSLSQKFTAIRY